MPAQICLRPALTADYPRYSLRYAMGYQGIFESEIDYKTRTINVVSMLC